MAFRHCRLTVSLSGRRMPHTERRGRTMSTRSRRYLITCHGSSERWLEPTRDRARYSNGPDNCAYRGDQEKHRLQIAAAER
jgi:hypothetical protein